MRQDRVRMVLEEFEQLVIQFMRKHGINHTEYRCVTDLLLDTIKAGEESLLFDVFLEAEATDIGNAGRLGSPEAIEGPFYISGAPKLTPPYVLPQRPDEAGDVLFFSGQVRDTSGKPLEGAELEVWQADVLGLYSNIHPGIPEWNLRGCLKSDRFGKYEVRTIVPPPYEIPKEGPTGRVLRMLGRHFFRPAHLHIKVRAPGYSALTSQIYFKGGEYIDSDVANAVRDELVTQLVRQESVEALCARGLDSPFYEVSYDFVLEPTRSTESKGQSK